MLKKHGILVLSMCLVLLTVTMFPAEADAAQETPYRQLINKINSVSNPQGKAAFAVQDVTGDSVPELIYITKDKPYSTVHIWQYRTGGLTEISTPPPPTQAS